MKTSYFAKYSNSKDGVSISRITPKWSTITQEYKQLAPPWELVSNYKAGKVNKEQYTEIYKRDVLAKLDAKKVYEDLNDKVLLCYEKTGDFCHRRIVADWIENEIGVTVDEVK